MVKNDGLVGICIFLYMNGALSCNLYTIMRAECPKKLQLRAAPWVSYSSSDDAL